MKCKECGQKLTKEIANKFSKDIYCGACFKNKKEEESQRRQLIVFIQQFFDIDKPTWAMFGQMKNFNNNGISYKNQRLTLQYLQDIEGTTGKDLNVKYGITIIPSKHEDMLDYYRKKLKERESAKKVDYKETKVKVTKKDIQKGNYGKDKQIDMSKFM